jgi:putative SOS response-associated peptidase YedK
VHERVQREREDQPAEAQVPILFPTTRPMSSMAGTGTGRSPVVFPAAARMPRHPEARAGSRLPPMCGRYTLTYANLGAVVAELDALLDPAAAELYRPRYNIAPTQATVVARPRDDRPALVPALWGFHRDGRLVINARSESAPARFPAAYRRGRCVVPGDGFYEWTGEHRDRRPVWFHAPAGAPLLMAGLFEEGPAGAPPSFLVLTTAARPPVASVHDRMPVLLSSAGARAWILGPPPHAVVSDDVALVSQLFSPRVNAVAHDDPACLAPPPPDGGPGEQLGLFR